MNMSGCSLNGVCMHAHVRVCAHVHLQLPHCSVSLSTEPHDPDIGSLGQYS